MDLAYVQLDTAPGWVRRVGSSSVASKRPVGSSYRNYPCKYILAVGTPTLTIQVIRICRSHNVHTLATFI